MSYVFTTPIIVHGSDDSDTLVANTVVVQTALVVNATAANSALICNQNNVITASAVSATELGYLQGATSNVQSQLNERPTLAQIQAGALGTNATTPFATKDMVLVSDTATGKISESGISIANLNALASISPVANIQGQLNDLSNRIDVSGVPLDLAANSVVVTTSDGLLMTANVTAANLSALVGISSANTIQGQLDVLSSLIGNTSSSPSSSDLTVSGNIAMTSNAATGNTGIKYTNASYLGPLLEKRVDATARWGVGAHNSTSTRIYANGTGTTGCIFAGFPTSETTYKDVLAITNTGNVGINTTTPNAALHIVGNVIASGLQVNGNARVMGEIYASGDITAFSDASLKSNLCIIDSPLAKVMQLTGYTFERTDRPGRRYAGLIAQDVDLVLPEAVHDIADHKLGVAYGSIVGLMVEAIKSLVLRIDRLEAQLGAGA